MDEVTLNQLQEKVSEAKRLQSEFRVFERILATKDFSEDASIVIRGDCTVRLPLKGKFGDEVREAIVREADRISQEYIDL